jgi:hypothetical protein
LLTVDNFWVLTLTAARTSQPPQKFLLGFDPSTGTDTFVEGTRALSTDELYEQFVAGGARFVECVEAFEPADWSSPGESPLGHVPARLLFGHAHWDSWLHERDVFVELGDPPPAEPDEVLAAVAFGMLFAGLQGGLVDDPAPVGPGLDELLDVTVAFTELSEPVRLEIDSGVRVSFGDPANALPPQSAIDLVECVAGRQPLELLADRVPSNLFAHLARTAQVL